jgi:hypothetical protein
MTYQPKVPFTGNETRMSDERQEDWLQKPLCGDLKRDDVPCCGPSTILVLRGAGVTTTYNLFGEYLKCRGSGTSQLAQMSAFKGWLEHVGVRSNESETLTAAVGARMNVGVDFECVQMTTPQMKSSRMTDETIEEFLAKDLTGDLETDFTGIGEKGVKMLARNGITHTCQLFGHLLSSTSGTGAEKRGQAVDDFSDFLKVNGVAPAYAFTVVHQVVASINEGEMALPGDQSYFDDRGKDTPVNNAPKPSKPVVSGTVTKPKESSGFNMWLLLPPLLLYVYAKFFM